uniref:VASt domain-containing protein n=1 Tax=Chaetoceros debilis TaxID=122233 RepID=A0A7S3Q6W0_9STRA
MRRKGKQKSMSLHDLEEDARIAAAETSEAIYRLISTENKGVSFHHNIASGITTASTFAHPTSIQNGDVETKEDQLVNPNAASKGKEIRSSFKKKKSLYRFNGTDDSTIGIAEKNSGTKRAAKNLWMCSYCGLAFVSEKFASTHEKSCIEDAFSFDSSQTISKNHPLSSDNMSSAKKAGMVTLSQSVKMCMLFTDESLFKAVRKAKNCLLTHPQRDAERELLLKARDRSYYDSLLFASRTLSTRDKKRKKSSGRRRKMLASLKSRLSDAYELIKEGQQEQKHDQYDVRRRGYYGGTNETKHDDETLYINIVVKHSIKFVNNELELLASRRWIEKKKNQYTRTHFDRLRSLAQIQAVRFAQIALAADMKPQNVAIQLSNDLYRLFPVQLKGIGAEINTDIEYRKGAFFILSVNVLSIDWIILMRHFHSQGKARKSSDKGEDKNYTYASLIGRFTIFEIIEECLAFLFRFHWMISAPICSLLYQHILKGTMKRFIITAVTDDFFQYVERKGMEMDLEVVQSKDQAAFMLEALHQIRKDERHLSQKKLEAEEGSDTEGIIIRGPLLGPLFDLDSDGIDQIPEDLSPPNNLETICLDLPDLPVGYHRLRRALLLSSKFNLEAFFTDALGYSEVTSEPWDNFDGLIGLSEQVGEVDESKFIGSQMKYQYLMPKSAFVKANIAYETVTLTSYNKHFFSLTKTITNPDVPYGKTFKTLSQIIIHNSGENSSRMVCSCEAEFSNGPPMVARQIKSGMRAGVTETNVLLGEAICKYAHLVK